MSLNLNLDSLTPSQAQQVMSMFSYRKSKFNDFSTPFPKQQIFMCLPQLEALYGGAVGGGKSEVLLLDILQYADVDGFSGIIFRKYFTDLDQNNSIMDRCRKILANKDGVTWNAKDHKFTFFERVGRRKIDTGVLRFGYLAKDGDGER